MVERINYSKNLEQLVLDAGAGDDSVTLDDNWARTTILGGTGEDTFQVGQIFKTTRDALANIADPNDDFQTTATTRGQLSNGVSYDTTIQGGDQNDRFVVFRNLAALSLFGEAGDDNFTIRAFAAEGSHNTDVSGAGGNDYVEYVLNAPVSISGGSGFDTVKVIGTEFSDQVVVTSTGVFGMGINVSYQNDIEVLTIDTAEGNDTFYVLSTDPNVQTNLYGGLGSDRFILGGDVPELFSGNTVIYGPQAGPHTLGNIAYNKLTMDGGLSEGTTGGLGTPIMLPGETNEFPSMGAVLSYQGQGQGSALDTMSIDPTLLAANGFANLTDLIGKTLEITSGPGVDRFWLITAIDTSSLPLALVLTLRNPAQPAAEWGLPTSLSRYAITHLSANFFVDENDQVDAVTVYNDADTTGQTGTLTSTHLGGLGMTQGIDLSGLEQFELFLGSGNDHLDVTGMLSRPDGFQTVTMINTGAGDDTVNVALDAAQPGLFALNTEAGDDTIDASSSTLPLILFGGQGNDTITGGQGNDIIFGDDGRVDFRNGLGVLITRLGLGLNERNTLDPGQSETTSLRRAHLPDRRRGPLSGSDHHPHLFHGR